jgi:hypothetical protein
VPARRGLIIGALDGRHRLGTERQRVRGLASLASSTKSGHDVAQALGSQPEDRLIDACDRHQQVVGADVIVTKQTALLLGQDDCQAGLLVKALEGHEADPARIRTPSS